MKIDDAVDAHMCFMDENVECNTYSSEREQRVK